MTIENTITPADSKPIGKPITLRLIFISNGLMTLSLIGYFIATLIGFAEPNIATSHIGIAAAVSLISFAIIVKSILGKNITRMRTVIGVYFVLALLAQFYIAVAIAIFSMGLSFHRKVKRFFGVIS